MAPWHIRYSKLKECGKDCVQERLPNLPLRRVIRVSPERCPPYTCRDRNILISDMEDAKRNLKTGLAEFSQLHFS
jgi:hypothetical protein